MPVKLTMRPLWKQNISKGLLSGVLEMATDVHRRAVVIAPVLSRALVNSGVIEPVTDGYRVKFGSSKVPYARKREFENKAHPQTIGYLRKAGESISRSDKRKYFRGKI